jgi:hypothetical protein
MAFQESMETVSQYSDKGRENQFFYSIDPGS